MASPQQTPGSQALEERDLDDIGASSSDSDDSYTSSYGSHHSPVCPWRTNELYDQECSRFFDCPSHLIERRISTDHSEEAEPDHDHDHSSIPEARIDAHGEYHQDTESLSSQEQEQPDIYTSSPRPEPTSDQEDPSLPSSSEARAPIIPVTIPDASMDVNDIWEARPRTQDVPVVDEPGSSSRERGNSLPEPHTTLAESSEGRRHSESLGETSLPHHHPRFAYQPISSEILDDSFLQRGNDPEQGLPPLPRPQQGELERRPSDFQVPRWQPDAEVTYCPICHTQFSFFVRKHHCRFVHHHPSLDKVVFD